MTGPKVEHAHYTREQRDSCMAGKCDRYSIVTTWPSTTDLGTVAEEYSDELHRPAIVTLNNMDMVHIRATHTIGLTLEQLDDFITQLQYAKWYLTEGKYYEQTPQK